MVDRFTGALPPPEVTVDYAIIPLCTVQPFLCSRFTVHGSPFTENPKKPIRSCRRGTSSATALSYVGSVSLGV
jgi:hypothetical protein